MHVLQIKTSVSRKVLPFEKNLNGGALYPPLLPIDSLVLTFTFSLHTSRIAACVAASRAIGTRNGEQLT